MINVNNICKKYQDTEVLKNVSLKFGKNEVVSIIGPSGAGKSTLLRCIGGLEKIDSGLINFIINNDSDKLLKPRVGIVFQNFNLFPNKTVLENVILAPMVVDKSPREQAVSAAFDLLKKVGLENKQDVYPPQLSGGQAQRIAIARALAMNPDIMLFDEPTSALDPELTGDVLETIKELVKEKMTIVIASHEMSFVKEISSRVVFMDEGRIIIEGSPGDIFGKNENPRLKKFLKRIYYHF